MDQKLDISGGNGEQHHEGERHAEDCNSDFINAGANICFYLSQNQVTMSEAKTDCQEKGAKILEEKSAKVVIKQMVFESSLHYMFFLFFVRFYLWNTGLITEISKSVLRYV